MSVEQDPIALEGGLNLVAPALSTPKGEVIAALNYECDQEGGYAWAKGYVPYDGAADALANGDFYTDDDWTFGTGWTHDSDTQEAVGSTATGNASHPITVTNGLTYRVRTIISEYTSGSLTVTVGGKTTAVYSSKAEFEEEFVCSGAPTDIVITPTNFVGRVESVHIMPIVPGNGDILGVVTYDDNDYAFRNNAGDTAGIMHKATAAGWAPVDLGSYIRFTAGSAAFVIGETITGGVSGSTAVIRDLYVVSGTWAGGTAAGYIALDAPSAAFNAAEAITSASGAATTNGADVAVALTAGGKYDFVVENVFGNEDEIGLFFVNGVGDAWQFTKNDAMLPLEHGITANPTHIGQYRKHIMLGFDEGAFAFSELGKPLGWSAVLTAGMYGVGDKVSGFKTLPTAFLVLCEDRTYILYGTSKSTFDLDEFEDQVGGAAWSIQTVSSTFFTNNSGIVDFKAVQDYGNFSDAAISKRVRPYITARVSNVSCSAVNQAKTQYRVFFDDKTAIYATFAGRKLIGMMPIVLDDQPTCMWNAKKSGLEQTLMGSENGKVFKMETGSLANGRHIESRLKLAYNHMGRPAQKKRVRKGDLYVYSDIGAKLQVSVDYNYGSVNRSSMGAVDIEQAVGRGALWDVSVWDEFIWDASGDPRLEIPIDGSGIAVAMSIYNAGMVQGGHRIDSLVYHYSNRGRNR